jgi:multiple sugar transport system permease protein
MRQSRITRLALHAANLAVIAFLLLPMVAATIGALQSEKSLQGHRPFGGACSACANRSG